jgi:IclR family KDG regulon transcriptional repressor
MKISSLEKCLSILELLSKKHGGVRIRDISHELGLPASSIHHILATLLPHNYVMQDPETKKYSLGLKLAELGHSALENFDLRNPAARHLGKLNQLTRAPVHLAVLRGDKVVYIDKIGTATGLSLVTYVGFGTEAHAAAGGKVLLADLDEPSIRALYPSGRMKKYAKNTVTSVKQLLVQLEQINQQGYAVDDEEYYEGVRCVAAPVKRNNTAVASVSVTGSIFTMTWEEITDNVIGLVMDTARAISSEL